MAEEKFLKKRAQEFWQRAKEDFQKERFNLCALDIEQTVQLLVKHLIFQKAGDFPKTHYFNILINTLAEIYSAEQVKSFYQENILQFTSLEDAYLTSRYLPKEFTMEEAEKLMSFVKDFFKVLEGSLHAKLI